MSKKSSLSETEFQDWKNEIINQVKNKSELFKETLHFHKTNPILSQPDVQEYLRELKEKYVIVTIDKAANNFAFICKKFYVAKIFQEVGIPDNNNNTYAKAERSLADIIDTNCELS